MKKKTEDEGIHTAECNVDQNCLSGQCKDHFCQYEYTKDECPDLSSEDSNPKCNVKLPIEICSNDEDEFRGDHKKECSTNNSMICLRVNGEHCKDDSDCKSGDCDKDYHENQCVKLNPWIRNILDVVDYILFYASIPGLIILWTLIIKFFLIKKEK